MGPEDQAALAAQSDWQLLEDFILENRSYILRCASRACGRFVTDSDDEWSVALMAFHEAVMSYQADKGPFRPFASLIIRRRVTDYLRSEQRHAPEIAVEPASLTGERTGEDMTPLELELHARAADAAEDSETARPGTSDTRDEIDAAQQLLGHYGFSFYDLTDCSPKAEKTRRQCAEAVGALLRMPELLRAMREKNSLPIKELSLASGVHKKVLERHRKYIIAAAELLDGDFPILSEYLSFIRKAVKE